MTDQQTGFVVGDQTYPVPGLETFTMDEAQVFYDRCGLTIEDFLTVDEENRLEVDDLNQKSKNPRFLRAMIEIAYRRGHPGVDDSTVQDAVRGINHLAALAAMNLYFAGAVEEADAGPPAETPEHGAAPAAESSGFSNGTSGDGSTNASAQPAETPEPTGTFV